MTGYRPHPPGYPALPPTAVPTVLLLLDVLGDACRRRDGDTAVQVVHLLADVAGTQWTETLVAHLIRCAQRRPASGGGA